MLIKDWEYWEDKLSMGHMALLIIHIIFLKSNHTNRWMILVP